MENNKQKIKIILELTEEEEATVSCYLYNGMGRIQENLAYLGRGDLDIRTVESNFKDMKVISDIMDYLNNDPKGSFNFHKDFFLGLLKDRLKETGRKILINMGENNGRRKA